MAQESAGVAGVKPFQTGMKIQTSEIQLTGSWRSCGGRATADETCERINELVRAHLRELGRDESGWNVLYRDPDDGRLWELIYPQSELYGGGPTELRCLTSDEAKRKYGGGVFSV
jgi:hypothetical protein